MAAGRETILLVGLVEAPPADEPAGQAQSPVWFGFQSTAFAYS